MSLPFQSSSYLSQVQRLRSIAVEVLKRFPVRVSELEFINHGENATFKVTARREVGSRIVRKNEYFLLRIHRAGYHSREAIAEELSWLKSLSRSMPVPAPVKSRSRTFIEGIEAPQMDALRNCDLLEWTHGHFARKVVRPDHMQKIGQKLAELQIQSAGRLVKHRNYWTADGLMGRNAKLGSVYAIHGITGKEQSRLTGAARELLSEFRAFEKAEPERSGLIHADLHFGNAVFRLDGSLAPIDFDDCGYGFHMYDLCVPLVNIGNRPMTTQRRSELRSALIEGYASLKSFDAKDEEMLHLFSVCRRIAMTGWLNSRADNPRLRKYLQGAVDQALVSISSLK